MSESDNTPGEEPESPQPKPPAETSVPAVQPAQADERSGQGTPEQGGPPGWGTIFGLTLVALLAALLLAPAIFTFFWVVFGLTVGAIAVIIGVIVAVVTGVGSVVLIVLTFALPFVVAAAVIAGVIYVGLMIYNQNKDKKSDGDDGPTGSGEGPPPS